MRCEELHAVLHLVLSAGNHLNAVSGPRPPPPRGPAAAVTARPAPGRLRGQRRRVSPGLAAEAARHQGQRAGRGPPALRGHGERPRERVVAGVGGKRVVVRGRSVMRESRSAPAGPLRTGCVGGSRSSTRSALRLRLCSSFAERPSVGCRSSPARPKVAPTPHPPHGARSAPLSCLSPTPPPPPRSARLGQSLPHRRHGGPRATSGPPQLCSSDGSAQPGVTAGSRPPRLRGASSRAVRAALRRPRGPAVPQLAVRCRAVLCPRGRGPACPKGRLGAAVALLPCPRHALIVSPSHMSVLCSYCILIVVVPCRAPVVSVSHPCRSLQEAARTDRRLLDFPSKLPHVGPASRCG